MKKLFAKAIIITAVVAGGLFTAAPAMAAPYSVDPCTADPNASICSSQATSASLESIIKTIVNILLYLIGIIAVIMLIIGGIRYAVSGGDQAAVTAAKNTILYAIIGLVVAIFAYAIVNWVLTSIL